MCMTPVFLFIYQRHFLYGIASVVALGPKVSKSLHLDQLQTRFFEACSTNSRQQHKLFSCEATSAAYQLVTIHMALTTDVAFYLLSLFFKFSRLCPLHNNEENGNVIKMILQFLVIKIQSQWG